MLPTMRPVDASRTKNARKTKAFEEVLTKEGFKITRGVGGMPTAFVATAGKGEPVVAILAEYDALPGLSQKAGEAKKDPEKEGASGHGCARCRPSWNPPTTRSSA